MIRVLIADDHAIVREGVRLILATVPDMQVQSTSSQELERPHLPLAALCDVLVLDVTLPGDGSGLDPLRRVKELSSVPPVLVISAHSEDQCGVYALRAGAAGYVSTTSSPGELVKAIRRIAGGGKYISPRMAEALAQRLEHDDEQPPEDILSTREFQVFLRLAAGERPTSIAHALKLSIKTISTYRSRILEKLNLKTNCHLFHYAIQRDLVFGLHGNEAEPSVFSRRSAVS